jgi:threonyl-tRNA synthetase
VLGFLRFLDEVYETFGFHDVSISLGLRPETRVGGDEVWDRAEKVLEAALKASGRLYVVSPNDGAFYGPKIDFRVNDAIGRPWQLGTIQCDFNLPELFDLHYVAEDGQKRRPVLLHRAILGSLERFLGVLIEHTGGDFPFWLAPEQVRVVPVSEKTNEYGEKVLGTLSASPERPDARNEKSVPKYGQVSWRKVLALLVVEKEVAAERLSRPLRRRVQRPEAGRSLCAMARSLRALDWNRPEGSA